MTAQLTSANQIHQFERAGLGKAPFKFDGLTTMTYQSCPGAPTQPGTCCDYCGTGICNVFYVKSADGKRFKVGCDCIEKVSNERNKASGLDAADRKLLEAVTRAKADHARQIRQARAATIKVSLETALADADICAQLSALPHPRGFKNFKTGEPLTLLDWATWMMANGGATARAKVAKAVKAAVAT